MKIAYDTVLDRPGCAVVQASFGCVGSVVTAFNADKWLTLPTPDMAVYEATPEQLAALVKRVNAR